ncbi:MAG: response regulator transcription factor [Flavobacterium sp.]
MTQNLIFVVDDDLFHHALIDYIISKNVNNPTLHFYGGNDCLKKIELSPKIIFLDCEMQEMDGLTTFQKIREINQASFIIFISGQDDSAQAQYLKDLGAFDYIVKNKNMHLNIRYNLEKIRKMQPEIFQ